MTDRLETMSIFVRVVEEGSLTAGARALAMPIATVSRRISELEDKLGAELLLRSPRGLTLTDTGQRYIAACRRILEEVAEAERNASGEYTSPRGTLTMTAPIVFGRLHVLPVVIAFLRDFPEIDIRLHLTDNSVNLHEDHLDLAVRIGPLSDSMLIARKVGEVRSIVCASPSYLAKHAHPKSPADLAKLDAITFQRLMSPLNWQFDSDQPQKVRPMRARLIVNTAEAAIDAAIDGLGFTRVLSYQAAEAIKAGKLVTLLEEFEPAVWPVQLLYEPRALIPQKLRTFLDYAGPRIATRMA